MARHRPSRPRDKNRRSEPRISEADLARAKRQIAFLRRYKRALKLRLNSAEALLVDGSRAPTNRGVVQHLLGKVDRATIAAALERKPLCDSAVRRAEFLAGASWITGDTGVLLDALEARRAVSPREDVARAFGEAIEHLDLARLSPSRLARVLELLEEVFEEHERVTTAFALLRAPGFRKALDQASRKLPARLRDTYLPLAAVHDVVHGRRSANPDDLERGLRALLEAPAAVLDAQPDGVRHALVAAALELDATWPLRSPSVRRMLGGLPRDSETWSGLAFLLAVGQCRLGAYDQATTLLDEVLEHNPVDLRAQGLLINLSAPRIGPIAAPDPSAGRLRTGYALNTHRPVHVRPDADAASIEIQRDVVVPGIAPIVLVDEGDSPQWFAVDGHLPLFVDVLPHPLPLATALRIAGDGIRIATMLGHLGLSLPDLGPGRFLLDQSPNRSWLMLADLTGARRESPERAEAAARTGAASWVRQVLAEIPFSDGGVRQDLRHEDQALLARFAVQPPRPRAMVSWLDGLL